MECFNSLLLKLREVHEREVEGWQGKIQELSNKKGCDTKRMEELFTKNQQMKEQQRLLTENIKTLENRLRAGLCDRCTVTQEVAKRRQQEFESAQIHSLQRFTLLAGEMNNLKKENNRLREELRNLRATLDKGHSDHSNSSSSTEVKPNSPDLSLSSGPVALTASTATNQPADGNVALKTEADLRPEESEHRQPRAMNINNFDVYKPLSWRQDQFLNRVGDRRSVEGLDQRSPIHPQAVLLKKSPTSPSGEVIPSRHVLHAPVPCRPQPLKGSPVSFPWASSESSDWVTPGTSHSPKPNLPRFPNLIPTSQHGNPMRIFGSPWHKQSTHQPPAKEPTVVFKLRHLPETRTAPQDREKKEILTAKIERVSTAGPCEGPLDLSDRGKSKSSHVPRDDSPLALQVGQRSPDKDVKGNPSTHGAVSSPSPVAPPSSSWTPPPPVQQQEEESTPDQNHLQEANKQEQNEEVNGTDQSNVKKVPVLTISLRPVVVLETLNSALQESLSSNGKSCSPAMEPRLSSDEQGDEGSMSGSESNQASKRKRTSLETETDRDSETDHVHQERKMKIKMIPEDC